MVDARVRYWEDAEVNGVSDAEGSLIPCREGNSWKPSIELATGKILGWPMGTTADIHYKICDDGDYWLADSEGNKLFKWAGDYVPDRLLCVGDSGYGDYIILKVREDGRIADWVGIIELKEWVELHDLVAHNTPATEVATCGAEVEAMAATAQVAIAAKEADSSEVVMARIKLPVSMANFADIAEVLSKSAKADGRTAFTRQVGDCVEIYSTEEVFK
jgi:hypothetical protein